MDLSAHLEPVLDIARDSAIEVDRQGRFPEETMGALRSSGLLGLTLPPEEVGGLGGGPQELVQVVSSPGERLRLDGDDLPDACQRGHDRGRGASGRLAGHAPPLADGHALGTLAFSETGSRSTTAPVSRGHSNGGGLRVDARRAGSPPPATPTSTSPPPATPTPRAASTCSHSR